MTPEAIVMFVVAGLTVWGGLAAALVHLARTPEERD